MSRWRALRRFLEAPDLPDDRLAAQARRFHAVGLSTLGLVTLVVPLVMLLQPDTVGRGLRVIVVIDALALGTLWLNRRGHPGPASWIYLGVVFALLTFNALTAGGIRSPGVQAYFIFVMLAGLLCGERAGVGAAIVAAGLGLALVVAEAQGWLTGTSIYGPLPLWLLSCIYTGVALLTMRLATGAVREALGRAEADLVERRAAESRLTVALEAGQIGVFDLDLDAGRVHADRRALALVGLDAPVDATVPYDRWIALVHPEDRPRIAADLLAVRQGGVRRHSQYRLTRPDGAGRHMEAVWFLTPPGDGIPPSLVGLLIDVTDRRRAEWDRERLLVDLGERVKELRLLHDATTLLRDKSGMERDVLAALIDRMPEAWRHPEACRVRISYQDIEVASTGWQDTPWRMTATFRTSSALGRIDVAYLRAFPDADEGPFLAEERELLNSLAELLRSNIEERAAEERRRGLETQLRHAQKLDALGTLAGGIAHDFNNLLTAIGGNVELALAEAPLGTPLRESLEEVARAQARARDLVKRILLFSRPQAVAQAIIPLGPVVEEALHLLRASIPSNVRIELVCAPDLPPVLADGSQIHQVIMNLGTNAAYAMQAEGGTLSVALDTVAIDDRASTLGGELLPGLHLRLVVSDTGTGMSPDVRERLFEPFFTTKGEAGTGLGLAVVHGIIRDHGGAIEIDSEEGKGTVFTIHFPASPGARNPAASALEVLRGAGQHLMYVDDDEALAFLMSRTLLRLGYRCTRFTDPRAALQEFRTSPRGFDAVITDLQMPGMSGLDLAGAIQEIRADVPIGVASGQAIDRVDDPRRSEVRHWIAKPSSLPELSHAVHALLHSR